MKVIGFAGWSGSGKTTLIEKLLPILRERGLRVSVIKHAHHRFDVDVPGKDSWRHREAGAHEVLITSSRRWALMHELRGAPEPELTEHLARLAPCDMVLIEGYRHAPVPKIEVRRAASGGPRMHESDPHIMAIASDALAGNGVLPVFGLDDPTAIADFMQTMPEWRAAGNARTGGTADRGAEQR